MDSDGIYYGYMLKYAEYELNGDNELRIDSDYLLCTKDGLWLDMSDDTGDSDGRDT